MDRIDPQHPQHSPGVSEPHPTAPIPPAEAASRYRQAAAHCRELSKACGAKLDLDKGGEFGGLVDALADARDEMSHCHCQLAAAGRLDLIGAQR